MDGCCRGSICNGKSLLSTQALSSEPSLIISGHESMVAIFEETLACSPRVHLVSFLTLVDKQGVDSSSLADIDQKHA
eukprot:4476940-Amphidinium_carterae.2